MSNSEYNVVVTCAAGLERLLLDELLALCPEISFSEKKGQLKATLPLALIYRICLWSRLASRVMIELTSVSVNDADQLYDVAAAINWAEHLGPEHTFAVDFKGLNKWLRHTNFGALRIKDAIVDRVREATGERPNVDVKDPSLRIYGHLARDVISIGIDISGGGLHRRGYRQGGGLAPMRETLAAALLYKSGWREAALENKTFLDPMCGSGTIVIEAAMIATDTPPGMYRERFGFEQWYGHSQSLWDEEFKAAEQKEQQGRARYTGKIVGLDISHKALQASQRAVSAARLGRFVKIHKHSVLDTFEQEFEANFVLTNPPYGERVGEESELAELYQKLAENVGAMDSAETLNVFSSRLDLCRYMPLRSPSKARFYNGEIETFLLGFDLSSEHTKAHAKKLPNQTLTREELNEDAVMLYNRVRKNIKSLKPWAKQQQIECYRVYDADLPEFSLSIDLYGHEVLISEYAAPSKIPEEKAQARFRNALNAISAVFSLPITELHIKERRRQKGKNQYQANKDKYPVKVQEFGNSLIAEMEAYLDTGIFLDHRPLRKRIMAEAKGKRFLNLFCYTAIASLHAAKAGAKTTSVDMSNTYLNWAQDNFILNQIDTAQHEFVQANCVEWLSTARGAYDLIMLDPPTFSNSKRMSDVFDVQRDHVRLIKDAMRLLEFGGTLYFSNNFRKFKLDKRIENEFLVDEISSETIDKDFQRNSKIHRCWKIKHG